MPRRKKSEQKEEVAYTGDLDVVSQDVQATDQKAIPEPNENDLYMKSKWEEWSARISGIEENQSKLEQQYMSCLQDLNDLKFSIVNILGPAIGIDQREANSIKYKLMKGTSPETFLQLVASRINVLMVSLSGALEEIKDATKE